MSGRELVAHEVTVVRRTAVARDTRNRRRVPASACEVPADLKGFSLGSAWATTDEKCKTKLYISKIIVGTTVDTYELGRYSLKSATWQSGQR